MPTAKAKKRGTERAGAKPKRVARAGRGSRTGSATPTALRRTMKAELGAEDGCVGWVVVGEQCGREIDQIDGSAGMSTAISRPKHGLRKGANRRRGGSAKLPEQAVRAFAAAGHPVRGKVLHLLLAGPATYRKLQKATHLHAGPLYHHVNQLRLAGLLLPKERDLYELTRGGRNLILTMLAVGPLLKDRRRRPVGR